MITEPNRQTAPHVCFSAQLTATQIRALDRDKTVVIIPGGILEEHSPDYAVFNG